MPDRRGSCKIKPSFLRYGRWFLIRQSKSDPMSLTINILVYFATLVGHPGLIQTDRVSYDHYYFNVPPNKRKEFAAELNYMETQFSGMKFIQANEQTYTAEEWIATQLLKDFDGRDCDCSEALH